MRYIHTVSVAEIMLDKCGLFWYLLLLLPADFPSILSSDYPNCSFLVFSELL